MITYEQKGDLPDNRSRQISELHYYLLHEGFLSSFGKDFLHLIYQQINASRGSSIIAACRNSEVVGFIAGGIGYLVVHFQLVAATVVCL